MQWLFMSNPGRYEKEKYVEHNGIEGSIDVFDKKRNTPIEFKTLRSSNIDKPKSFQEEQLRYYTAMQDSPIGYMIYQCIMHFGNSPWKRFKVIMTEQQRKEQLEKLVREITSLQNAMKAKDPSLARNVYLDRELNWLCKECPYAKECQERKKSIFNTQLKFGNEEEDNCGTCWDCGHQFASLWIVKLDKEAL